MSYCCASLLHSAFALVVAFPIQTQIRCLEVSPPSPFFSANNISTYHYMVGLVRKTSQSDPEGSPIVFHESVCCGVGWL
jgi:hypothetical protein